MGVPNTETFSLQDVANEIGLTGSNMNLPNCFSNAIDGGFDSNYHNDNYAPDNSLLRFRNYQHVTSLLKLSEVILLSRTSSNYRIRLRYKLVSMDDETPVLAPENINFSLSVGNFTGGGFPTATSITIQEGQSTVERDFFFTASGSFTITFEETMFPSGYSLSGNSINTFNVPQADFISNLGFLFDDTNNFTVKSNKLFNVSGGGSTFEPTFENNQFKVSRVNNALAGISINAPTGISNFDLKVTSSVSAMVIFRNNGSVYLRTLDLSECPINSTMLTNGNLDFLQFATLIDLSNSGNGTADNDTLNTVLINLALVNPLNNGLIRLNSADFASSYYATFITNLRNAGWIVEST